MGFGGFGPGLDEEDNSDESQDFSLDSDEEDTWDSNVKRTIRIYDAKFKLPSESYVESIR